MVSTKKSQSVVALILTLICSMGLCAEPNQVKAGLKFESNDSQQQWVTYIDRKGAKQIEIRKEMIRGSFRPRYVAVFYVRGRHVDMSHHPTWDEGFPDFSHPAWIRDILSTPAGKALSQGQRDLLHTGACILILGRYGDTVGNHQHVRIYAVSEKDARQTVQAFIESLSSVSSTIPYLKNQVLQLKEKILKTKKQIPEKEAELKSKQEILDKLKKSVHYLSADEAKATVLEFNKTLDTLEVEIAGLRAKITTIENHKSDKRLDRETLARLEGMLSEQSVELAGALARRQAAMEIRDLAHEFCTLNTLETGLRNDLWNLKADLSKYESELQSAENQLAHPTEDMLPPQLFQNKVTIYPVRVETSESGSGPGNPRNFPDFP